MSSYKYGGPTESICREKTAEKIHEGEMEKIFSPTIFIKLKFTGENVGFHFWINYSSTDSSSKQHSYAYLELGKLHIPP